MWATSYLRKSGQAWKLGSVLVLVQALIDYLEGGETIDGFLAGFPTIGREQVVAFLEEATARMIAKAS
jgi:uncharacterized protein (DUF433 family)